jgi:hypothetical protein
MSETKPTSLPGIAELKFVVGPTEIHVMDWQQDDHTLCALIIPEPRYRVPNFGPAEHYYDLTVAFREKRQRDCCTECGRQLELVGYPLTIKQAVL